MMKISTVIGTVGVGVACILGTTQAKAANLTSSDACFNNNACENVAVELAFILDASDSVSLDTFNQQLAIYQSIFTHENFFNALVKPVSTSKIAVSVFTFGVGVQQNVGWTVIDDQESATQFGNAIVNISKKTNQFKSQLGDSIAFATNNIRNNAYAGNSLIFDVASDGLAHLENTDWEVATQAAYNAEIDAINAIAIAQAPNSVLSGITTLTNLHGAPLVNNPNATWRNPNGSPGFIIEAGSIDNYRDSLVRKLAHEILPDYDPDDPFSLDNPDNPGDPTSVPEPSAVIGLISLGILGILSQKNRK